MPRHIIRRRRLTALAVTATLVGIVGSASAGALGVERDDPRSSKATVKTLNKQLKRLTKRVVALEGTKTPSAVPPTGPARGDLTGSYPNPTIAANAVGAGEISDDSVTGFEIAANSLYAQDLAADSVGAAELAFDSVGARALKGVRVVVSSGVAVPAGDSRNAYAFCLSGEQVTGGGFAWQTDQTGTNVIGSTPDTTPAGIQHWVVTGRATSANTLYAWALCLPS